MMEGDTRCEQCTQRDIDCVFSIKVGTTVVLQPAAIFYCYVALPSYLYSIALDSLSYTLSPKRLGAYFTGGKTTWYHVLFFLFDALLSVFILFVTPVYWLFVRVYVRRMCAYFLLTGFFDKKSAQQIFMVSQSVVTE